MEDETGQFQYHGHLEGAQSATYYLLMLQGKEFAAIPAGSWYARTLCVRISFVAHYIFSVALVIPARREQYKHMFLFCWSKLGLLIVLKGKGRIEK